MPVAILASRAIVAEQNLHLRTKQLDAAKKGEEYEPEDSFEMSEADLEKSMQVENQRTLLLFVQCFVVGFVTRQKKGAGFYASVNSPIGAASGGPHRAKARRGDHWEPLQQQPREWWVSVCNQVI